MMQRIRRTVATLALVLALAQSVNSMRSLRQYCADLSWKMGADKVNLADKEATLRVALQHLLGLDNAGEGARMELAHSWLAVVDEEPCGAKSAEHVSIISLCAPQRFEQLATLTEAARRHAKLCLTADFWDEQLKSSLAYQMGAEDKTGLSSFVDEQFIEQYRSDNPNELELGQVEEANECCKAWRSLNSLVGALSPILNQLPDEEEQQRAERIRDMLRHKSTTIEGVLQKHLFKPCNNYLLATHALMEKLQNAARFHESGSGAFVSSLSRSLRNAIFRFQYCAPLPLLGTPAAKLAAINASGQ